MENEPLRKVSRINIPCLFFVAKDDKIALPKKVKMMYKKYKGKPKRLKFIEGEHNSIRKKSTLKKASKFLLDVWNCVTAYKSQKDAYIGENLILENSTIEEKNFYGQLYEGEHNIVLDSVKMTPKMKLKNKSKRIEECSYGDTDEIPSSDEKKWISVDERMKMTRSFKIKLISNKKSDLFN